MFFARIETRYVVFGVNPVIVCLYTPGFTALTSTPFTETVCWKFELLGSQEMIAEDDVIFVALTHEGPNGASFPIIMVQAASRDVRRLIVTERTLIR